MCQSALVGLEPGGVPSQLHRMTPGRRARARAQSSIACTRVRAHRKGRGDRPMSSEAELGPPVTLATPVPPGVRTRPQSTVKFLAVGASGLVVNQVLLLLFTELAASTTSPRRSSRRSGHRPGTSCWRTAGRSAIAVPTMGMRTRYGTFMAINVGLLAVRGPDPRRPHRGRPSGLRVVKPLQHRRLDIFPAHLCRLLHLADRCADGN